MTLLLLMVGCAQPVHLQYDHGRAYYTAAQVQADLARKSVEGAVYPLSGAEAEALRLRVQEATTDEESGATEATK